MIYSSRTTRSFYDSAIHDVMPDDVIELSAETHRGLIEAQSYGMLIDWAEDGVPFLCAAPQPTNEQLNAAVLAQREAAYKQEADPLFFQYQREEVTKQVWLDKIEEIKARYPKQEV